MIKAITILAVLLLITGCTPASDMNLAKAQWLCKDDGYLYKFRGEYSNPVICRSGRKFSNHDLKAVIMPVEFARKQGLFDK